MLVYLFTLSVDPMLIASNFLKNNVQWTMGWVGKF